MAITLSSRAQAKAFCWHSVSIAQVGRMPRDMVCVQMNVDDFGEAHWPDVLRMASPITRGFSRVVE